MDHREDRQRLADQASYAAGLAYRAGEYVRAGRLLNAARAADPSRAELWAERTARVHAAARKTAAEVASSSEPRPLAEIVADRLKSAGVSAGDAELQFVAQWNAQRQAQGDPEAAG